MMRPGRSLITKMRSDMITASIRSWVIRRVVIAENAMVWAKLLSRISLVCASSAENGSSSSTMAGSIASVRASAARWRMPPES